MTYNETIDYLYSRLPVFHRIGAKALKPGLTNTLRLCEAFGNPQHQFESIHVGGTNGKGSTSHMLASIYQEAGYRVGLYTSPHLKSFTERIRINGQPIPEAAVVAFVERTQDLIETVSPSFFELTVAMAFDYFAREQVDLAIVEVGLGGRLDSTNVITPALSLITNIGYDHMDVLGDTLALIAGEKAGIIKPGIPVVIGEYLPETQPVFQAAANSIGAPIHWASDRFIIADNGLHEGRRQVEVSDQNQVSGARYPLQLDLTGRYQLANLPAVLEAVDKLQTKWPVPAVALLNGLASTIRGTGIQGRFQTISEAPRVILDTAHNLPGMQALLETISTLSYRQLRIVIGLVGDKNPAALLDLLPAQAVYYVCAADSPRSMPVEQLGNLLQGRGLTIREFNNVNNALGTAMDDSAPDDLTIVTGSNYIVSEVNSLTK